MVSSRRVTGSPSRAHAGSLADLAEGPAEDGRGVLVVPSKGPTVARPGLALPAQIDAQAPCMLMLHHHNPHASPPCGNDDRRRKNITELSAATAPLSSHHSHNRGRNRDERRTVSVF